MAELYQVYGGFGLGGNGMEHFSEQEEEEPRRPPRQQSGSGASTASSPIAAPTVQQHVGHHQQGQQQGGGEQQNTGKEGFQNMYNRRNSYTFFDKMAMKRSDVVKLAVFSLVIVLAIAIDRMSNHYLSKYLTDNIFTNFQEFMIRLAYPVIVFLIIWVVKSL